MLLIIIVYIIKPL